MRKLIVLSVCLSLVFALVAACAGPLDRASARYKLDRDLESLVLLQKNLKHGMPRLEVERLLGAPGYSPTEGQFYYESNRRNHVLVVDYRRGDQVTDSLQRFEMETIGQ